MGTCIIQIDRSSMMVSKQRLKTAEIRRAPPYVTYQIKTRDCVITVYEPGKLVFQGSDVEECAALIVSPAIQKAQSGTTAKKTQGQPKAIYPQAGSDEVGVSDYFGSVTVCVTCVHHEDVESLRSLGMQDSKAIDDTVMWRMTPKLMKRLPHSFLISDNVTYNRIHGENNMAAIKPRVHNQAYVYLRKKTGSLPQFCITGQFVQKTSYYRYLKHEREVVYDIHFEIKVENKYLSVAAGPIIIWYAFLKTFDAMCEQYDFAFLRGADSKVDQNIREFVAMHGKEAPLQAAKLYFANIRKALG